MSARIKKAILLIVIIAGMLVENILFTPQAVKAQVSETGVLFLLIPPGARHNGMGQAGVAIAKDANAIYYNPGALALHYSEEKPRNIEFMHVNWLPGFGLDLFYDYASMSWYMPDIGVVGMNFTYFNLGEQQITDNLGNPNGTISSFDMSIGASYATKLSDDMGLGGNLKFIHSKLANKDATGQNIKGTGSSVAIDIGFMKKNLIIKDLTFGASLVNIGPKISYIDEDQADPLPTNLRIGLAYPVYKDEFNNVLFTYEINRLIARGRSEKGSDPLISFNSRFFTRSAIFTTWSDNGWHRIGHNIGAEYTYSDFLALRTGTALDVAGKVYDLNFGAGIKYDMFKLDFAYSTRFGGEFNARDGSQFYSLGVIF